MIFGGHYMMRKKTKESKKRKEFDDCLSKTKMRVSNLLEENFEKTEKEFHKAKWVV